MMMMMMMMMMDFSILICPVLWLKSEETQERHFWPILKTVVGKNPALVYM